jgi:DNA replication and repair protein RecF
LFAPEDLSLVRGDPAGRRRFLDELLVLLSPRFSGVFSDYDRVLRQRNSLLKSAKFSTAKGGQLSTLEIWDERLIEYGSEIIAARSEVVARLRPEVTSAYVSVAGADHHTGIGSLITTSPRSTDSGSDRLGPEEQPVTVAEAAEGFRGALAGLRRSELERGITLVGPHRDDLILELNDMPARGYASHGESWSFALSLKLASAVVLQRDSPLGDPVLVLDDVFAELDESRRSHLAAAAGGFDQVLITAAVFDDVPAELNHHTVEIKGGRIVEPAQ